MKSCSILSWTTHLEDLETRDVSFDLGSVVIFLVAVAELNVDSY